MTDDDVGFSGTDLIAELVEQMSQELPRDAEAAAELVAGAAAAKCACQCRPGGEWVPALDWVRMLSGGPQYWRASDRGTALLIVRDDSCGVPRYVITIDGLPMTECAGDRDEPDYRVQRFPSLAAAMSEAERCAEFRARWRADRVAQVRRRRRVCGWTLADIPFRTAE